MEEVIIKRGGLRLYDILERAYAARYGEDIAGLMLCGPCPQWKGCEVECEGPAFRAAVEAGLAYFLDKVPAD